MFEGFTNGVNLGGWFSQCDYTEERYAHFVTEPDFAALSTWGIDHVRIPVDYNLVQDEHGAWRESGFAHLERAVAWCRKYGLNMVLDLHKTAGFSFDAGEAESGFFESGELQERFYVLWETLARRFGTEPFIAFELLNEVTEKAYGPVWNRIARTCIGRIRAIAPRTWLIVGSYWNNSIDALADLDAPYDDRIVYNFHCYEPLLFTHQGAYWIPGMPEDFRLNFRAPVVEYKEKGWMLAPNVTALLDKLAGDRMSGELFDVLFAEAVTVAEKHGVPLYCGEYGVIDRAAVDEALDWYRAIHAAFAKYGIGHAVWNYRGLDFGLVEERAAPLRAELLHPQGRASA